MKPGWLKLGLLAAGLLALRLGAYAFIDGHIAILPHDLCRWDCLWYIHTASAGYDLAPVIGEYDYSMADWAFLPLYPALIHMLSLTGLGLASAGFVLSNLCLFGFMLLGYRYLALLGCAPRPLLFFAFILAFPYGIYFSFTYTESLYALLAAAALIALQRRANLMAAGLICLLGITRVTGILLLAPLALNLLRPGWALLRQGHQGEAALAGADALLPLAIAPLGLSLFMAYLYLHMGDALAFLHVQSGWQRSLTDPFYIMAKGLLALLMPGFTLAQRLDYAGLSLCAVAGLWMACRVARLGHVAEAWFLAATILLAAGSSLVSLQRYVFANPVFLLFLYHLLATGWRRRALPWLIAACIPLQAYFLHLWLSNGASLV